MAKPDAPTPVIEPRQDLVPTTVALDQENLDWLDGVAEQANRSRSDALRQILRGVREQQDRKAS